MFVDIFIVMSKEIVLSLCISNYNSSFRLWNLYTLDGLVNCSEKIAQNVSQRDEFSFRKNHFFPGDVTLLCLAIAKLENLHCGRLFDGVLINSSHSMLGVRKIKKFVMKKNCFDPFRSNFSGVLFRENNIVCSNWEFAV